MACRGKKRRQDDEDFVDDDDDDSSDSGNVGAARKKPSKKESNNKTEDGVTVCEVRSSFGSIGVLPLFSTSVTCCRFNMF